MATNVCKAIYDKISDLITEEYSDITGERLIFRPDALEKDFRHPYFIRAYPNTDDPVEPYTSGEIRRYTFTFVYYHKITLVDYDDITAVAENLKDKLLSNRCISTGEWHYLECSVDYSAEVPEGYEDRYWGFTMNITVDKGVYVA
jgi:hypothetical protein